MQTANYLNLDILFHRDSDHYTVRARNSVGSESSRAQSFVVPFTPQEREMLTGDMPDPGSLNVTPQQVGQRLYEALFQGEVRDLLVRSHEQARTLAGLRLRLHLNDTAELALLPWEYLYDAKEARFLALTARLSIVRYLALGEPPQALQVEPPLRVLVVLANPTDIFPPLDVEAEWQQLQTVLAPLVDQGIIELVRLPQPTRNALADHLEQYPVHVLHFVGHGNHDAASGEGGLYLVDDAGAADFVPASVLQVLLADTRDRRNALRLAFLNGCLTGRSAQIDPFAGTAQQLVQHGVPAVIAMQYSVTDDAATELAYRFYRALARSYPVDAALAQARKGVYIQGNYLEWGTPVLFLRAPDGQLFTVAGAEKLSPLLPDVECPYRGLEVFEAEHAPLYFGRGDMIQRLLAKVAETNFIAVVGPSGSGKSSLVRAGLIPSLAKGALTGSAQWAVATLRPGSDPVRSLISGLLQLGDPQTDYASRIAEVRRLANMLMADELPLADLLDPLHERHPGLVLVVDQFEEAFTLCSELQARDRFFAALLAAAAQDWIKVILTLRADFWGHVLDDKQLDKPADAGQVNVLVMTRAERRAAIEKPAHAMGRRFEEGLVSLILDELEAEPGELPLLEFALTELWARQSVDGVLTHDAYEAIGKVGGAIARRADETFQRLRDHERRQVRTVFTRLVRVARPEEGDQDTKRRIILTELDQETQVLVQRLASARLLVTGTERDTGQPYVEIAHEALIRSWQELKDWLNRDREFLLWRQRLLTLLESWQRSDEDPDVLLRGTLLSEAERQAQNRPSDLDEQERAYIAASRQAETKRIQAEAEARQRELENARKLAAEAEARRKAEAERAREADARRLESEQARRTLRRRAFILAMVALIAVIAAGVAFDRQSRFSAANTTLVERNQQLDSVNETLNQQNLKLESVNNQLGQKTIDLTVALENAELQQRMAQSRALTAASQATVDTNQMRAWLLAIEAGRVANTEQAFAAINKQDQVVGKPLMTFSHDSMVNGTMLNKNGSRVLSWSLDGTIHIWDSISGKLIHTLYHEYNVQGAVWNRNESRILSWSADQTVRIWDAAGEPLYTLLHEHNVNGAMWNEDESRILSWSADNTVRLWGAAHGELLRTLSHNSIVNGAAWNRDERRILSWSADQTVRIWNATSGELLHTLFHDGNVSGAVWNRDESRILSWSTDNTARLWDAVSSELLYTFSHDAWVNGATWNHRGSRILSWSDDRTARIWDATTGELLLTLSHNGNVNSNIIGVDIVPGAQWNGDESRVLTWTGYDNVRIWDTTSGELLQTLAHDEAVSGATWDRNDSHILSWSNDGTVRIWDVNSGEQLHLFSHESPIQRAAWDKNENRILAWDFDNTVRIWDAVSSELLHTLSHDSIVYGATYSRDGSHILSWSRDNTVRVWNTTSGELLHTLSHDGNVNGAVWNEDESHILSWSGDASARIWDATTGELLHTLSHDSGVNGAVWDREERRILSWSGDASVRVWDATSGELLHTFSHDSLVNGAAWSGDGTRILSWGRDFTVRVWNAASGELRQTLSQDSPVNGVAWSGDGTRILSWGGTGWSNHGEIRIWDATTGGLLHILSHDGIVSGAQWNGAENRILSWSQDKTIRIWDATSGALLRTLLGNDMVSGTHWNQDERRIQSWSGNTVHVWDASSGELLYTLVHDVSVNGVVWNGDESHILSWSRDGIVRIWNADSGKSLQVLDSDDGFVTSAQWNPSESEVIVTTHEGKIYRYFTHMEDLLEAACTRATRNLTWQEWQQYLPGEPYQQTCPNLPVHPSVPESALTSTASSQP